MKRKILLILASIEIWSCVLLLLLCISLSQDWSSVRGPNEWRWSRYSLPGLGGRVWVPTVVCLFIGLIAYRMSTQSVDRLLRGTSWRVPTFLFVASLAIQAALLYLEHPDLLATVIYRTVSSASGGYFNVAGRITDAGQFLRSYPTLMRGFELHPSTHPPGLPLLFWAVSRMLGAWPALADSLGTNLRSHVCQTIDFAGLTNAQVGSAVVQMSTPIWGALVVFPLTALSRRLYGEATARRGLALFLFTPALVLWATRWNQLYAFLTVLALYVVQQGLDTRRCRWFLLAGTIASLATFLDFANLALAFISLLYWNLFRVLAAYQATDRLSFGGVIDRHLITTFISWVTGAVSIWVIYYWAFGVGFFEVLRVGLETHASLNRSYAFWVGYNLYDFFLFLGIATALVVGQAAVRTLRSRPASVSWVPVLTFWITLLVLDGSGVVRGQAARLWLFLVPLAVLAALPRAATLTRRSTALLLAAQIVQLLVCGFFLRTVGTGLPYCETGKGGLDTVSPQLQF